MKKIILSSLFIALFFVLNAQTTLDYESECFQEGGHTLGIEGSPYYVDLTPSVLVDEDCILIIDEDVEFIIGDEEENSIMNVYGNITFSSNSVLEINDDVTFHQDSYLKLEDGVSVSMCPAVSTLDLRMLRFWSLANFDFIGTELNRINFDFEGDTGEVSDGFRIRIYTSDFSQLDFERSDSMKYCNFENGARMVKYYSGYRCNQTISNCIFEGIYDTTQNVGDMCFDIHAVSSVVSNNIFRNSGYGIEARGKDSLECDDLVVRDNEVYDNQTGMNILDYTIIETNNIYENNTAVYIASTIVLKNNLLYENHTGITFEASYEHQLEPAHDFGVGESKIINNTIYNNSGWGIQGEIGSLTNYQTDHPEIRNNIVTGNTEGAINITHYDTYPVNPDYVLIKYNCIEGIEEDMIELGAGVISDTDDFYTVNANPQFVDPANDDYSLKWNSTTFSPCIDTGDPDFDDDGDEWDIDPDDCDADGTPLDMGAIPAREHECDKWTMPNGNTNKGYKWMCFPVINRDTADYDLSGNLFSEIMNPLLLDYVQWVPNGDIGNPLNMEYEDEDWTNKYQDFISAQGCKVKMQPGVIQFHSFNISGDLEEPTETFTIRTNTNTGNWLGYFIESTQSVQEAFGDEMDNLYSIKTQTWSMVRKKPKEGSPWIASIPPGVSATLSYGDLVIVEAFDDNYAFEWHYIGSSSAYVRENPEYFSYEEKADYMPIIIEHDPTDLPTEVGVLINGECKGAAVVVSDMTQINGYILDDAGEDIEIVYHYDERSPLQNFKDYNIFDPNTDQIEKGKISVNPNKDYYLISFDENSEFHNPIEKISMNCHPNPFNPTTTINYSIPNDNNVDVSIYNVKGQKVTTLIHGNQSAGRYSTIWNGTDSKNNKVSSGIYFYKIVAGKNTEMKKMVLMK
jgi:hypothetical protein